MNFSAYFRQNSPQHIMEPAVEPEPQAASVAVLEPEILPAVPEVLPVFYGAPVRSNLHRPPQDGLDIQVFLDKLKPLSQVRAEAFAIKPYLDVVIRRPHFEVAVDGKITVFSDETAPFELNPTTKAESQLASRYNLGSGLPATLRSLKAYDELAGVLEKAAARHKSPLLFRQNGNGAFAALSPSYKRMDNRTILRPILEAMDPDEWGYKSFEFGDPEFSKLYLVHKTSARMIQGDPLFTALQFTNSEDGSGRYRFDLSILRLACLNGVTVPLLGIRGSYVHRGRRMEVGMAGDPSIPEEIQAMIPDRESILNSSAMALGMIERAMSVKISRDPRHILAGLSQWSGLSFAERDELVAAKEQKYPLDSVWAWTNSLTQIAKGESVRRNAEIEAKGWSFLKQSLDDSSFLGGLAGVGRVIVEREEAKPM